MVFPETQDISIEPDSYFHVGELKSLLPVLFANTLGLVHTKSNIRTQCSCFAACSWNFFLNISENFSKMPIIYDCRNKCSYKLFVSVFSNKYKTFVLRDDIYPYTGCVNLSGLLKVYGNYIGIFEFRSCF